MERRRPKAWARATGRADGSSKRSKTPLRKVWSERSIPAERPGSGMGQPALRMRSPGRGSSKFTTWVAMEATNPAFWVYCVLFQVCVLRICCIHSYCCRFAVFWPEYFGVQLI